jgi:hypothetical protein
MHYKSQHNGANIYKVISKKFSWIRSFKEIKIGCHLPQKCIASQAKDCTTASYEFACSFNAVHLPRSTANSPNTFLYWEWAERAEKNVWTARELPRRSECAYCRAVLCALDGESSVCWCEMCIETGVLVCWGEVRANVKCCYIDCSCMLLGQRAQTGFNWLRNKSYIYIYIYICNIRI